MKIYYDSKIDKLQVSIPVEDSVHGGEEVIARLSHAVTEIITSAVFEADTIIGSHDFAQIYQDIYRGIDPLGHVFCLMKF